MAADFLRIGNARCFDRLAVCAQQTLADRVRRDAFRQRSGRQQIIGGNAVRRDDLVDVEHAFGHGTGFIKNHAVHFGQHFQIVGAFDQPIPAKKLSGILMTSAHGQLITRNVSAR